MDSVADMPQRSTLRHSEQIHDIAAALAKAQAAIVGASKDKSNPHFGSKYADLASVWEACRKPLTENGLSVIQSAGAENGRVRVSTMLLHVSGQWFADDLTLQPDKPTPQAVGSAITYGRRYALAAFAGVAPEDDDGESAEGRGSGARSQAKAAPVQPTGYEQWLADMEATADGGTDALKKAWAASPEPLRVYASKQEIEALKKRAAKADKAAEQVPA